MATLGLPVADPGFLSGGGSNVQSGCANLYLPVMFMFSQVSVCRGGVSTPLHTGIHPPGTRGRHPPGRHALGRMGRHTPWANTRLGRHFPGQTPTLDRHPLPSACWDTPLPCAVHAGIQSTSGWYASHWNAFLFYNVFAENCMKIKEYGRRGAFIALFPQKLYFELNIFR